MRFGFYFKNDGKVLKIFKVDDLGFLKGYFVFWRIDCLEVVKMEEEIKIMWLDSSVS